MNRFVIGAAALLAWTVSPASGQIDEDLARRLREAQEWLDRPNATLRGLRKPRPQFDPESVRRLDQRTARDKAQAEAEQAAAQERARQEMERTLERMERNRSRTTTCRAVGGGAMAMQWTTD